WSGSGSIPAATLSALATALHESTGTGAGSIDWTFSGVDNKFDFLAAGETLTVAYDVTVTDNNGAHSTQTVTVTITGTNDAPGISSSAESGSITELANTTGSSTNDSATGTLNFTDVDLSDTHTVSVSEHTPVWSGSGSIPAATLSALATALSTTLHESTGTGAGSIDWTFSGADNKFDFLAAGETLTVAYDVTVTDNNGAHSTQTVTVTITGTNDAPGISSSAESGSITELANTTGSSTNDSATGTLNFTDVDLSDTHTVSVSEHTPVWSGSGSIPAATLSALATALSTTLHESTGTGAGSIDWTFSGADNKFDFLAAGETLTVAYDVTVTDNNGAHSTQTVTVTITGTNDAPGISSS